MTGDELYRLPAGGRIRAAGLYPVWVLGMWGGGVLALWAGTQYLAQQWAYAPALGPAWLQLGHWKLYPLWQGVLWAWWGHNSASIRPQLAGAMSVMLWTALGTWTMTTIIVLRRARQVGGHTDLHGSAHWATRADLRHARLLDGKGVYVGAVEEPHASLFGRRKRSYLQHGGPEHLLLVAPPRSGKGVNTVVPTLLTWPHSVLVHDPKDSENWRLTSGWRARAFHQHCIRFDPTCTDGTAARYNPLLEIRPWPYDFRDALTIAEAIIERDLLSTTKEAKHWDDTAAQLLVAVVLHVLYAERNKSLAGCYALLTDPVHALAEILEKMRTTVHDPDGLFGWTDPLSGQLTGTHPVVAHAVRAVENKSPNERSSVVSSAIAHFTIYQDAILTANTERCDFSLGDLLDPAQPVSLYLTTPTSELEHVMPLMRILINLALRRMTERMPDPMRGWATPDVWRLLLMLDEFPEFGRIPALQAKLAVLASFGVKTVLVAQDLAQIHEKYGRDESLTSTCNVQVCFAPNKLEMAKWISEKTGQRTIHREQRTYTGSRFALWLPHVIASEGETQRPLLTPDEALRLPQGSDEDPRDPGDLLVFVTGQRPVHGKKIRFYADPEFRRRADPQQFPPPPVSDRIAHDWSHWLKHKAEAGTSALPMGVSIDGKPDDAREGEHHRGDLL